MAISIAAVAMAGAPAHALDWRTGHSVTAGAGSESNLALRAANPEAARYASATVTANVLARRPGLTFELQPQVRALRYADDAQWDRNDVFAVFGLDLDNRRRSFALDARYARESTLTSEFESSGLFGVNVERVERGADAAYSRALRGGHGLGVAVSAVETSYGDSADPNFADFGVRSVRLSHSKATSTRTNRNIVARKSFVDAPSTGRQSVTTELQASWSSLLSPTLQGSVGVGAFVVDPPNAEPLDPSASLNLSLARHWPRWTFSASAGRGIRAQAGGVVVVEDSAGVAAQRRLGERLSVGMYLRGARTSSAIFELLDFSRTFANAGASVNWRIARRLDLAASVYERTEYTTFTPRASSLASTVSLTYRSG